MKLELTLPDGRKWMKLTSRENDQKPACELSKTMVGYVFAAETAQRHVMDGGPRHPDFFLLLSADGQRADVAARVSYSGKISRGGVLPDGTMLVGYGNQNPFPDHAEAIKALSGHVGVALPSETYPYGNTRPAGYVILPAEQTEEAEDIGGPKP